MKPILSYNIEDNEGNVIFKFPPNTLLERIIDVWPLIINYYQEYYPFAIGKIEENTSPFIKNYRPLTYIESKKDNFIKLFSVVHKKNRIRYLCWNYTNNNCIYIEEHYLQMDKHNIFFNRAFAGLMTIDRGTYRELFKDNGKMSVSEYESTENVELQLLVLSDIVF